MFDFELIGNLGQDAIVREANGRKFVSLNVSSNDSYTKEDGTRVDNVQWVSCTWEGDGGKLLPYLKKGQKVFVRGRGSTRLYSSEKERRMVAGANISVRQVELLSGAPEAVPHHLYDRDGVQHDVVKYYHVSTIANTSLFDMAGREYVINPDGWVLPPQPSTQLAEDQQAQATQQQEQPQPAAATASAAAPAQSKNKKKNKKDDKQEQAQYDGF